jgi:hypothetical protein
LEEDKRNNFELERSFEKKELKEKQLNQDSNHIQSPSYKSIEFWSSRGNIGEKINILIGLNILVVNLLTAIMNELNQDKKISDTLIEELKSIKDYLIKILEHPESGIGLREKIVAIEQKLGDLLNELPKTPEYTEELNDLSKDIEIPKNHVGAFLRNITYADKWGINESLESLLDSYSNLSHLGFPSYYLTACKELLYYDIKEEYPQLNQQEIVQIPVFKIKILINKLLREAPAARLLQNLRRLFPNDDETYISSSDLNIIQDIVKRFFMGVSEFFDNERSLLDSIRASSGIIGNYNLGAGDLESRIPNVSFSVVKEIQNELKNASGNDFKQFILSETIIFISRLNDSLLQNERFVTYLRRLK